MTERLVQFFGLQFKVYNSHTMLVGMQSGTTFMEGIWHKQQYEMMYA